MCRTDSSKFWKYMVKISQNLPPLSYVMRLIKLYKFNLNQNESKSKNQFFVSNSNF